MRFSVHDLEEIFTGQENYKLFPQASLHTQWPGGPGVAGNPSFDQFYASQVESIANGVKTEELNDPAIIALLEKIGPAILLTHSQSGVFGWKVEMCIRDRCDGRACEPIYQRQVQSDLLVDLNRRPSPNPLYGGHRGERDGPSLWRGRENPASELGLSRLLR